MNFDLDLIRERIKINIEENLLNGKPNFNNDQIKSGIDLFLKLVAHPIIEANLQGLPKSILQALSEAFISKRGEMAPLRALADAFEPFFKKYCIVVLGMPASDITGKALLPVLKLSGVNKELTKQVDHNYPNLSLEKLVGFREKDEYLYQLCSAYLVRNEVHLSPNWGDTKVFNKLTDILTILVYAVLKEVTKIDQLPTQKPKSPVSEQLDSEENKLLYDFISFGDTATELKTQVVNAYILHFLYEKESATIEEMRNGCINHFDSQLSNSFFKRRVEKLADQKKIHKAEILHYELTVTEKARLNKVYAQFTENKDIFLLFYGDLLTKYGAILHFDPLLEKLTEFFIKNFNIDVKEAYGDGNDIPKEDQLYDSLISYIYEIITPKELGQQFFKEILKLCEDSDFIVRVSASKVLGKLTNPANFELYVKAKNRTIYLDTQIILHILCTGYLKTPGYENIYFQTADELMNYSYENPQINLRLAKPYLNEVAYQLKLALLLIPFEDHVKSNFSTNVFYRFYDFLKNSNQLETYDDSFEAFLANWLSIKEEDVYDSDSHYIIQSSLINLLSENYGITVETLPPYNDIKEQAVHVLEGVLKKNLHSPKSSYVLKNDALMVCHLSNQDLHRDEPFFLTWDKSFVSFRKTYKERFHRNKAILWHLFSPAKFLSHMSLLTFKIDPASLTHEYLSILESLELYEKTKTLYDYLNSLTDIKNISKEKHRRYVQLTVQIFDSPEFISEFDLPEDDVRKAIAKSFESLLDEINIYYYTEGRKYNIEHYRKMMLDENYFIRVAEILKEEISQSIYNDKKITEQYFEKLNELIKAFIEKENIGK